MENKKHKWIIKNFQSYNSFLLEEWFNELKDKCLKISHTQFTQYLLDKGWRVYIESDERIDFKFDSKKYYLYISKMHNYIDYGEFTLMKIKELSLFELREVNFIIDDILNYENK